MSQHSSNVNIEINALWHAGKYDLAYVQISRSLVPILVNWVGSQGVHQDDCADIVGDALQAFWKKVHDEGPLGIERPAAYLWRAAFTKKCDYWHKSKKLPVTESSLTAGLPYEERISPHQYLDEQFHSGKGRQFVPDFQRKAIYLVEGLFDDAEVSESDAPFLVEETVKLMRADYRTIIEIMLTEGPVSRAECAQRLGITEVNFGVRKTRALAQFRELLVSVAAKAGIGWRGIGEDSRPQDEIVPIDFEPTDETEPDEEL